MDINLKIKDMKKFTYAGYFDTTFTVQLNGRNWTMTIEPFGVDFEVYGDGGSFGRFGTFGKAVAFAEKYLMTMAKNNPA